MEGAVEIAGSLTFRERALQLGESARSIQTEHRHRVPVPGADAAIHLHPVSPDPTISVGAWWTAGIWPSRPA